MAYQKQCDYCRETLGGGGEPYLQIHGTISEQIDSVYQESLYRFITPHYDCKLAFCNLNHFVLWAVERGENVPFRSRSRDIKVAY